MNKSTRNATMELVWGISTSGLMVAVFCYRWMHHRSPWDRFELNSWLVLFSLSLVIGIARILYYRNRRDYFAEEMDHRRSLAKDLKVFELKARS